MPIYTCSFVGQKRANEERHEARRDAERQKMREARAQTEAERAVKNADAARRLALQARVAEPFATIVWAHVVEDPKANSLCGLVSTPNYVGPIAANAVAIRIGRNLTGPAPLVQGSSVEIQSAEALRASWRDMCSPSDWFLWSKYRGENSYEWPCNRPEYRKSEYCQLW